MVTTNGSSSSKWEGGKGSEREEEEEEAKDHRSISGSRLQRQQVKSRRRFALKKVGGWKSLEFRDQQEKVSWGGERGGR